MYELQVLRKNDVVHVLDVQSRVVTVGRGPTNDLTLSDPDVSWHHASFWQADGQLWLRDQGSTNGTFLGEARVTGTVEIQPGEVVRLGSNATVRLVKVAVTEVCALALEDVTAGLVFGLPTDRFYIGSARDADLRLPDGPDQAAILMIHPGPEVWIGTDDQERALAIGEEFEVGGRRLRLVEMDARQVPTTHVNTNRYPYRIEATLEGTTGPEATLIDLSSQRTYRIDAGNRAVLLYLLARRVQEDRAAGRSPNDVGWCSDEDVKTGVWGRMGDDNKLHVLIYRIRAELKKGGFDPWFIEKRHRFVRARVDEVNLR